MPSPPPGKNTRHGRDEEAVLKELEEKLHLPLLPRRIECYDISNIQGRYAVGSRVVFSDGRADKALYRHYRIRTVDQADDFAMMHEVLSRRFAPGKEEDNPDLIVVDGGIGQLNVLTRVLRELDVAGVAAAGLAKSRVEKGMTREEIERSAERVFLPGRKNPVVLRQNSAPLLLLARIRDEAHRFAITYHKKVRGKETITSRLAEVPGIGEKRLKALLRHFGSLQKLQGASLEEISAVQGDFRERCREGVGVSPSTYPPVKNLLMLLPISLKASPVFCPTSLNHSPTLLPVFFAAWPVSFPICLNPWPTSLPPSFTAWPVSFPIFLNPWPTSLPPSLIELSAQTGAARMRVTMTIPASFRIDVSSCAR